MFKWIHDYLKSSIGKKQIMGLTGGFLALFLLGHMVGNLQLLNPDPTLAQAHFNAYSELLTGATPFIYIVEVVLLAAFLIHIAMGVLLKLQNKSARGPVGYAVNTRKGPKAWPTFVMIYTGICVLAFLVWHLKTVKYGAHYLYLNAHGEVVRDMWLTMVEILANPVFAVLYFIGMIIVGIHLWHAIGSAFQTLGISTQKWTPIIDKLSLVYCVVVAGGFALTAAGSYALLNNAETKAMIETAKSAPVQDQLKLMADRKEKYAEFVKENRMETGFPMKRPDRGPKGPNAHKGPRPQMGQPQGTAPAQSNLSPEGGAQ
jgi:succinate dehydrogenase / fumarate reductase cytochrome b subunit